jgi:hypothetical protein
MVKMFPRMLKLWLVSLAAFSLAQDSTLAQAQPQAPPPMPQPEFPPIQQVTQGYASSPRGFLILHVDMKKHRMLGEIPGPLLRRPFLLATSITGGSYTGWQWDDRMVFLERLDRKLVLVEPEIHYKAQGSTLAEVVRRTYRDQVITSMPILAEGQGGSCLIDFTDLFAARASIFVGSLGRGIDPSLTKITKAKVFQQNVEIGFDLAGVGGSSGASPFLGASSTGTGIAVHYSLRDLPTTGYAPRPADDRIGYFVTALVDFTRDPREETRFVRFANRWQLQKLDPTLEISEPKDPIVFFIEKTVPVRYRRYVQEGIEEWNKAFEKLGFYRAIQVRQQTDTNEYADYDPEDTRWNFFRWITSEQSFAMGPSRVHPETGQIMDADVIFDDSMIRDWLESYGSLIEQGPVREFHPALCRYLDEHPERHPLRRWKPRAGASLRRGQEPAGSPMPGCPVPGAPAGDLMLHALSSGDFGLDPEQAAFLKAGYCDFGDGICHQVNFGLLALGALGDPPRQPPPGPGGEKKDAWPEEFIGQVIKETVMHEVGHTLGLRHNFKASTWLSLDQINAKESPPEALTGSVMDYNPVNIAPPGKPQGFWNARTLGPYDYWAIEYGYTLKNDPKELARIAARVAEAGLAYATDEDTSSSDPLVFRFDLGSDPLDYARTRLQIIRSTIQDLLARVVKQGQSYQRARQAFEMLLYEIERSASITTRFVGGHYIHRDHKGDPNARAPVVPVPAEKQREALRLLCDGVLGAGAFSIPPETLNYLAAGRWVHWGSSDRSEDPEYPIHDRILQVQLWSLFGVLNPRTYGLLLDAEARLKENEDALTLPEFFTKLTDSIWSEIKEVPKGSFTNRKPLISTIRRNLQQEFTGQLIDLALEDASGPSPATARTQAWVQLSRLRDLIFLVQGNDSPNGQVTLDDYSKAHFQETVQRIVKALDASFSRGGAAGGGSGGGVIILGTPGEDQGR